MSAAKNTTKTPWYKRRALIIFIIFSAVAVSSYYLFFRTTTIGPITERNKMILLEETKQYSDLQAFESDKCSFNISQGWESSIKGLSKISPTFAERYADVKNIPFEAACVQHDKAYHKGEGGYQARLQADDALRSAILSYGINNTEEIKQHTGLDTDEEAIFLYEVIAEAVYYGVRVGGAPCSGMPYAWGFGYGSGICSE